MEMFLKGILIVFVGAICLMLFLLQMFWPFIIPFLIISQIRKNRSNNALKNNVVHQESYKNILTDVSASKLAEIGVEDINVLKQYLFQIYYDFETAYNNLDYNTMAFTSTPKLYNAYHTNILLNLRCGQKKIIDQIKRKNIIVYDVLATSRKQVILAYVEVSNVSYMQDYNGKILSGTNKPITEKFEVMFIKNYDDRDSIKCPNCGATVKGNECEYCGTAVRNSDFRIDSIRKIV